MNKKDNKILLQITYLKIWRHSLAQIENNNQGAYIWYIKSKDNNSLLYCHIGEELIKEEVEPLTDEELQEIETALNYDGFETSRSKNDNILITATKENIYKPVQKKKVYIKK